MANTNKSGKLNQKGIGSKSSNFETNTRTEDLVLAETAFLVPNKETDITSVTEEEVENAIVMENGATSIDFMLPEEEREILSKNLNKYSDMKKMKDILNIAKQTKVVSEEVETLNQISKSDKLINQIFDVMTDEKNIEKINEYIQQKLEAGDVAKAYKELGLMNKAMIDAREGMINRINTTASGKKTKIALKFTNDSGQDFQLGAEING